VRSPQHAQRGPRGLVPAVRAAARGLLHVPRDRLVGAPVVGPVAADGRRAGGVRGDRRAVLARQHVGGVGAGGAGAARAAALRAAAGDRGPAQAELTAPSGSAASTPSSASTSDSLSASSGAAGASASARAARRRSTRPLRRR